MPVETGKIPSNVNPNPCNEEAMKGVLRNIGQNFSNMNVQFQTDNFYSNNLFNQEGDQWFNYDEDNDTTNIDVDNITVNNIDASTIDAGTIEVDILIIGGTTFDPGKFKVNAADALDYFEEQARDFQSSPLYNAAQDLLCKFDTTTDVGVKFRSYIDASSLGTYSDTAYQFLVNNQGTTEWGTQTTITVITDIQYDTTSHKIQKKTRSVKIVSAGAESGWTDVTTAEPC